MLFDVCKTYRAQLAGLQNVLTEYTESGQLPLRVSGGLALQATGKIHEYCALLMQYRGGRGVSLIQRGLNGLGQS